MFNKAKDMVKRIEAFLADKTDQFEIQVLESGTVIGIYPRNGDPVVYHGYELSLLDEVSKKLNSELQFKIVPTEGYNRFMVTTEAEFNLKSYINSTNLMLRQRRVDSIHSVYLSENVDVNSPAPYCILTASTDGTWLRYELTQAELLYAAVFNLPIEANEQGVFVFNEMIEMHRSFHNELLAVHGEQNAGE